VSLRFELVGERRQLRRLAEAMRQGLREQPVGEPGVARQEWTVEVRPGDPAHTTAFEAALAVVAEAGDDTPEWIRAWIEPGSTDVVLEAG
jgi:hypothetical protein